MDSTELRRLLSALQREIEGAAIETRDEFVGFQALSVLAGCVARGNCGGPDAFVRVATLLELSNDVPAVKDLLLHFPVLTEQDEGRPATG